MMKITLRDLKIDPAALGGEASPGGPGELFVVFTRLTLSGFGGVLPFAQRVLVDDRRWLSQQGFLRLLSVAHVLPGPNLVNLALLVGEQSWGWRGAIAALAGMLLAPMALVLALGLLAGSWSSLPAVHAALHGMALVTAGMVIVMALRMAPLLRRRRGAVLWAAAAFGSVGLLHWSLLPVMLALGVPALLIARWSGGEASQEPAQRDGAQS